MRRELRKQGRICRRTLLAWIFNLVIRRAVSSSRSSGFWDARRCFFKQFLSTFAVARTEAIQVRWFEILVCRCTCIGKGVGLKCWTFRFAVHRYGLNGCLRRRRVFWHALFSSSDTCVLHSCWLMQGDMGQWRRLPPMIQFSFQNNIVCPWRLLGVWMAWKGGKHSWPLVDQPRLPPCPRLTTILKWRALTGFTTGVPPQTIIWISNSIAILFTFESLWRQSGDPGFRFPVWRMLAGFTTRGMCLTRGGWSGWRPVRQPRRPPPVKDCPGVANASGIHHTGAQKNESPLCGPLIPLVPEWRSWF